MVSLIHDTSPILRHSLQQSHNKGLYYGFRDTILSRLVTIIKRLVHHAVYCMSLSCLLSFLCNPYIPFLIYEIIHLLVSFHFFAAFSSESYRMIIITTYCVLHINSASLLLGKRLVVVKSHFFPQFALAGVTGGRGEFAVVNRGWAGTVPAQQ